MGPLVPLVSHIMGVQIKVGEGGRRKPGYVILKVSVGRSEEGVVGNKHHGNEMGHSATWEVALDGTNLEGGGGADCCITQ